MKTNTAQQEILLMTGTSFSSRSWCEKDDEDNKKNITPNDKLKEACWNGLLPEMLPEICLLFAADKKLFLWQITEASSFIDVELGEIPGEVEKHSSINPHSFLELQLLS
jgi:hypothetical protein